MDRRLVARLSSGEGWGLLQSLPPYEESGAMALLDRLRRAGFDAELAGAALTQSRLRGRAAEKFGDGAADMLFTPDGLEQATRAVVADHHARRFAAAGVRTVYDLGCGIGADAMAFARAGMAVHAVDADDGTAAVAAVNLRPWPRVQVEQGLAQDVILPTGEDARGVGVWLDPARRTPGVADIRGRTRRTFRLDELSPDWDSVRLLASRAPVAGAKLSPSFPHAAVPAATEAAWTSVAGDVVECCLWWGGAATRIGRTAHVLGGRGDSLVTEAMAVDAPPPGSAAEPDRIQGRYLYEPDRAVLRAGLVGALANAVDGREMAPGVGYVLADAEHEVPWARRYLVQQAMPFNVKALRAILRDRRAGRVTIKKRGVSVDPDQLRRQLRPSGDGAATVVLTRSGDAPVALLVQPG